MLWDLVLPILGYCLFAFLLGLQIGAALAQRRHDLEAVERWRREREAQLEAWREATSRVHSVPEAAEGK